MSSPAAQRLSHFSQALARVKGCFRSPYGGP